MTVLKGADFTVYCILAQIEAWRARHQRFPEEIYIQLDGGGENANSTVPAILELLASKRMARRIWYTRLPVGHTHDDVDGCFGVIWTDFRGSPCMTLDKYKERIENAFGESKTAQYVKKVELKDVYVIPDYSSIMAPLTDKPEKYTKTEQMKHQWRFEAVERSVDFPLGCKTTYRAYVSDTVIEFTKKPKQQCVTPIGRVTGLEPARLSNIWYPSADTNKRSKGVEGTFLLRNLPKYYDTINDIPIARLPTTFTTKERPSATNHPTANPDNPTTVSIIMSAEKKIYATIHAINLHFTAENDTDRDVRRKWNDWFQKYAPRRGEDVRQYSARLHSECGLQFHCPLWRILFQREDRQQHCNWHLSKGDNTNIINPYENFPTIFAASMDYVVTQFNPVNMCPQPGLFVIRTMQAEG